MINRPTHAEAPLFVPPVDPTVRRVDVAALAGHSAKILARLEQGPASAMELVAASGGFRVAARVHDLNEHFERTNDPRRIVGGYASQGARVYVYRLTTPPPAPAAI